MLDKLGQEIIIGSKVIVVGGHGELQRMIVEKLGHRDYIKCRPTDEDSCAKVKKLMDKRANQSIVIDDLVKLIQKTQEKGDFTNEFEKMPEEWK